MQNKKKIKSIFIVLFFSIFIAACGPHVTKLVKSDISATEDYMNVLNAWSEGHQAEAEQLVDQLTKKHPLWAEGRGSGQANKLISK